MKKHILAIDIGTNSTRYSLYLKKGYKLIESGVTITRLGENIRGTKKINPKNLKLTLDCLKKYINKNSWAGPEIKAIGTQALRTAANSRNFIKAGENILKTRIKTVSGKEEALLGFSGAKKALGLKKMFFIDIGGGSTEVGTSVYNLASMNIGCVTIKERFLNSYPYKPEGLKKASTFINSTLKKINFGSGQEKTPLECGAIGGTCTTLAAIHIGRKTYNRERIQGYRLTVKQIKNIFNKISGLKLSELKKLNGLEPKRADVIGAGTLILLCILEHFGIEKITVSDEGILLGVTIQRGCRVKGRERTI